jgi:tricorn protease interacting factor F2/3
MAPLEYRLSLEVDYESEGFQGQLTVFGLGNRPEVRFDCEELAVLSVHQAGRPLPFHLDGSPPTLVVSRQGASPGPLEVTYSGRASKDQQTGLFVSRLGNAKVLTTMMEPEGCRRLLPCFDRPDEKAVFQLRVVTQPTLTVISNTECETRPTPDGRREWVFAATPPMSTYLLYLGIGPFTETESTESGTRIVVASAAEVAGNASEVLRLAGAAVRSSGEFFGIPYPLRKLHFVALTDFWAGMENWGAIAGDDSYFAFAENASPTGVRMAVETIAHEVAHQWFGDLVTLQEWKDIWLNESFATFVVPKITERALLRQDPWGEFMIRTRRGAFADSLHTTHPVAPESIDPREIMGRADEITYFKGAQLLRMIEGYLGPDPFRNGVAEYLRRHAFGNARSEDLWKALEETSGRKVTSVMRPWVERPGHPLVVVDAPSGTLRLTQRRFSFLPADGNDPPWPIPLTFEIAGQRHTMLFEAREIDMQISHSNSLRVNPGRTGFYRVLYSPEHRQHLVDHLLTASPFDRWGMLSDAHAFLLSGDYGLEEYLQAVLAVCDASDYMTVGETTLGLSHLTPLLGSDTAFRDAARRFHRTQLDRLGEAGSPGEPDTDGILREWIALALAESDEAFGRSLAGRFDQVDAQDPALRPAIAWSYARYGGEGALERLLARAQSVDSDVAFHAAVALGGLPTSALLERSLDQVLAPAMRLGNAMYQLESVARSPEGRAPVWSWLTRNLREYERRTKGSLLLSLTMRFVLPLVGPERAAEVRKHFSTEEYAEGSVGIRYGLELMEVMARLRERVLARSR